MKDEFRDGVIALLPALRGFARSLCGDPSQADDLVQETVLKAWSSRDRFREGSNLKAWLFTILRNLFYSGRRHLKREVEDPDGIYAENVAIQPEHVLKAQMDDLNWALQQLPEEQREALLLVCATELSCEEAAQICGCPVGTIKSRIARGRDRLVKMLGAETVDNTFENTLETGS